MLFFSDSPPLPAFLLPRLLALQLSVSDCQLRLHKASTLNRQWLILSLFLTRKRRICCANDRTDGQAQSDNNPTTTQPKPTQPSGELQYAIYRNSLSRFQLNENYSPRALAIRNSCEIYCRPCQTHTASARQLGCQLSPRMCILFDIHISCMYDTFYMILLYITFLFQMMTWMIWLSVRQIYLCRLSFLGIRTLSIELARYLVPYEVNIILLCITFLFQMMI